MVAAIAIDRLLNNSSHGVAYVFCNYKSQVEQKEQDAYGMLSAILKQLMQAQPPTLSTVEKLYRKHADRGTKLSLDEISSALQNILLHFPTTYIVIDALDECQDQGNIRRQFLPKLRNLQAVRDVRLLVTSRLIPEIEDAFQDALRLEVQASKDDIELFVAGQMDRLPSCVQGNTTLQKNVRDKIVKASDGMYVLYRIREVLYAYAFLGFFLLAYT
jgi:hypothetical protein